MSKQTDKLKVVRELQAYQQKYNFVLSSGERNYEMVEIVKNLDLDHIKIDIGLEKWRSKEETVNYLRMVADILEKEF